MPRKARYTKEEIADAALKLVSQRGIEALSARELGVALGTSTSPIFTVFESMEELQLEVKKSAMRLFESFTHKSDDSMPAFKRIGMQMILFAKAEPNLYRFLFMSPNREVKSFDGIFARLGDVVGECLDVIQKDYGLTGKDAKDLFEHTWIHTFGIGTLCATGVCDFSKDEISEMLTRDFTAMLTLLKLEKGEKS